MKRLRKPIFAAVLGVVLYLIATTAGAGWLYVVSATIAAVVAVSALVPLWNVRGIEVSRRAPVVATAGEPFECSLELKNTGRLARHLLEVVDGFAGDVGRGVAVRLARGGTEVVRYRVTPRRGIYTGGEATVESGAPFGMFFARRKSRVASSIVVYPRTWAVAGLPPSSSLDAERKDQSEAPTLRRGLGGEFWGIREYRTGDPARLIAWKKSARGLAAGKLAVLELAEETHPPSSSRCTSTRGPRGRRARPSSRPGPPSSSTGCARAGRFARTPAPAAPVPGRPRPRQGPDVVRRPRREQAPDPEGASVEVRPSVKRTAGAGRAPPSRPTSPRRRP
ncbi:DUF58 domain-containing protein [Rubrobacter marinus]|uniref:DUF58 domain-containing protein n=1 Tax=Rubrobacter marinus TaxID=2653852 RepID=A0A6G8PTM9_9ACTN|nr:DUF58 domain-containing protein [Rubrobacter marinus]QIN77868.1 DUF58 domain-containing protein [Rubrobacter marinus]